ncbi:related to extracellular serine-rich protein [Rhynchosporium graminicola]|uniref:Related to extracellular serine-rich protein n=1 Tax=Rhynchosporium graminicola TaxID=2792576 RepID=A0A1E1JTK4_9HELO|nr:related to extracellular serine-rich protein [Rhynchosporium commune]
MLFYILSASALLFTHSVFAISVQSTILVIAKDTTSAYSATSGLTSYGIPFRLLTVPATGAALPALSTTGGDGNFGGIVVLSEVSYEQAGGSYVSALTEAQWTELYNYQTSFGVRMTRLDAYPEAQFGTGPSNAETPGCCDDGVEQLISISNSTSFSQSGMKIGATMSTLGLYHYPSVIVDPSIATTIAQFGPAGKYTGKTTAAVINKIDGREQMVWFIGWATDWSPTSTYLDHAWITWMTRGLYAGFRRIYFSTQVDDMFLETELYSPEGVNFRIKPADLDGHVNWTASFNAKLPAGSTYFAEMGHNGNGNIEASLDKDPEGICDPKDAIQYPDQVDTELEFQKPLGSGEDIWPATPATYVWSRNCSDLDPLQNWWTVPANRDTFAHVTHTFSHSALNNATYADANKEITFNKAWLAQVEIDKAERFSGTGLIPPAITGMHNGDALKAFMDNGIVNGVGDNTRPVLRNAENEHWPLITTVAGNGYPGFQITPRWATSIYYNCDLPACTVAEWIATSAGAGDIQDLLKDAVTVNSKHLLSLHHDPFMFHQANLRWADVPELAVNGVTAKYSLLMMWVESVTQELLRLVEWPLVSQKHDDIAAGFASRMARDKCAPNIAMNYGSCNTTRTTTITGVTVTTNGNVCDVEVPVTLPGPLIATQGRVGRQEQLGSDPLTVWLNMTGDPVKLVLRNPVALL